MLNVGLVGIGYWGPNVARSLVKTERVKLTWICDTNRAQLDAFGERYPESTLTGDAADVFDAANVDAVAIATPTGTHYALVKAALEAGKHVFVEKPLTADLAEAQELVALAEKQGLILMVGHVFQYNASILALKDVVASGELGSVHYLSLVRTNLGPVRTDVNALWDLVSHDAYIMMDLLGEKPLSVSAVGQSYLNAGVEDVVFATFRFPSGAIANVHASWLNPRKVRQITVTGEKKMAVWDDLDLKEPLKLYDKRVEVPEPASLDGTFLEFKTMVVDGGTTTPRIKVNEPLLDECHHFVDCVETNTQPRSGPGIGLDVVRALTAAAESIAKDGASVKLG